MTDDAGVLEKHFFFVLVETYFGARMGAYADYARVTSLTVSKK